MKTYKETKQLVKNIIIKKGLNNLDGYDYIALYNMGCTATNVQNAVSYFQYSPKAKNYC